MAEGQLNGLMTVLETLNQRMLFAELVARLTDMRFEDVVLQLLISEIYPGPRISIKDIAKSKELPQLLGVYGTLVCLFSDERFRSPNEWLAETALKAAKTDPGSAALVSDARMVARTVRKMGEDPTRFLTRLRKLLDGFLSGVCAYRKAETGETDEGAGEEQGG